MTEQNKTASSQHACDYPHCSERGSGHPLACNCRSSSASVEGYHCWEPLNEQPEDCAYIIAFDSEAAARIYAKDRYNDSCGEIGTEFEIKVRGPFGEVKTFAVCVDFDPHFYATEKIE